MAAPTDTLFSTQWHLHNSTPGQFDLNVLSVWNAYTGAGVKVMVIDDGFDHDHDDLTANFDTAADRDYADLDDDAAPASSTDNHGTAVMGIIGAAKNGVGVVGVAYGATMIGARISYDVTADKWREQFVSALGDAVEQGVGVINMSFGGAGDYDSFDGASNVALMHAALEDAVANGRDGLGIALVKSAGNERLDKIDVNHNQSDNDSRQIIVAAVNRDGTVSEYSSYGAPILVAAFGSGFDGEVVTTDRSGADGDDTDAGADGDYTMTFNGTSAAAPMVSGVVALMQDANADLGWRDIQTILAISARHVGSDVGGSITGFERTGWSWNGATNWNGGGMHYSLDYGYGLVDALAAVRLAESWTAQSTSANQVSTSFDLLDSSIDLPDGDLVGTTLTADVAANLLVERVTVTVSLTASFDQDFRCYLTGPDGQRQELIADAGYGDAINGSFTFHAQGFRGLSSRGDWSVTLVDDGFGDAISVSDAVVSLFGAEAGKNDVYYYTNEFSDFIASHAKALTDKDGGVDTLNAAAVSSALTLDLATGKGRIDGVAVTLKGVENILGGDGADRLTGSKAANALDGARGADLLTGGAGRDALDGGAGSDRFIFLAKTDSTVGKNRDVISDFTGADLIDLKAIDARQGSGNDAFRFINGQDFHDRAGELHAVRIDKSGKANDLTLVEGDINGDGKADFQIALSGLLKLTASDFAL
ncbi:subtilisin-like proprotein convertase family protein [Rhizobium sp. SG_E_25_P2]|uniref:S8 family serine peptidase n=1 Tax=Rhizobium sp. SG_E_25_P2 TaxID=2879942 RepID=UPI002475E5CE|nr:S8 family serine peptidase [Rhizobium sp. SG_E_25_P2]MDH6268578.1 subtilisin-like proprotein convertase family protein [Rhizobium sp. SG_E_25_P2]